MTEKNAMESNISEVKQIAAQLLAGMLSNPHIYPNISDEGVRGEREQILLMLAVEMSKDLIGKIEKKEH